MSEFFDFHKFISNLYRPKVLVIRTPLVDRLTSKYNLNFAELLQTLSEEKTSTRNKDFVLNNIALEFISAKQTRSLRTELIDKDLENKLLSNTQTSKTKAHDEYNDQLNTHQDLLNLFEKNRQNLDSKTFQNLINQLRNATPQQTQYKEEFLNKCRFDKFELLDHPVALIIVVSIDDNNPLTTFTRLSLDENLPSNFKQGVQNLKNILRQYVLVCKDSQTKNCEQVIFDQMQSKFGRQACHLIYTNSTDIRSQPTPSMEEFGKRKNNFSWNILEQIDSSIFDFFKNFSNTLSNYIQLKKQELNQKINGERRGIRNQFKLLFTSNRQKNHLKQSENFNLYEHDSIETSLRLLADLSFMLGDYVEASSNYSMVVGDYTRDKAQGYFAGAQESQALSLLFGNGQSKDVEQKFELARSSYLKIGELRRATRTGIWMVEGRLYQETLSPINENRSNESARRRFLPLSSSSVSDLGLFCSSTYLKCCERETDIRAALLLEQAAQSFLLVRRPTHRRSSQSKSQRLSPMLRRYAQNLIMSALFYAKTGFTLNALRCYERAQFVYCKCRQIQIDTHIQWNIARLSSKLGLWERALDSMCWIVVEAFAVERGEVDERRKSQWKSILDGFDMIVEQYKNSQVQNSNTHNTLSGEIISKLRLWPSSVDRLRAVKTGITQLGSQEALTPFLIIDCELSLNSDKGVDYNTNTATVIFKNILDVDLELSDVRLLIECDSNCNDIHSNSNLNPNINYIEIQSTSSKSNFILASNSSHIINFNFSSRKDLVKQVRFSMFNRDLELDQILNPVFIEKVVNTQQTLVFKPQPNFAWTIDCNAVDFELGEIRQFSLKLEIKENNEQVFEIRGLKCLSKQVSYAAYERVIIDAENDCEEAEHAVLQFGQAFCKRFYCQFKAKSDKDKNSIRGLKPCANGLSKLEFEYEYRMIGQVEEAVWRKNSVSINFSCFNKVKNASNNKPSSLDLSNVVKAPLLDIQLLPLRSAFDNINKTIICLRLISSISLNLNNNERLDDDSKLGIDICRIIAIGFQNQSITNFRKDTNLSAINSIYDENILVLELSNQKQEVHNSNSQNNFAISTLEVCHKGIKKENLFCECKFCNQIDFERFSKNFFCFDDFIDRNRLSLLIFWHSSKICELKTKKILENCNVNTNDFLENNILRNCAKEEDKDEYHPLQSDSNKNENFAQENLISTGKKDSLINDGNNKTQNLFHQRSFFGLTLIDNVFDEYGSSSIKNKGKKSSSTYRNKAKFTSMTRCPIRIAIKHPDYIEHDFSQQPMLEVPVKLSIGLVIGIEANYQNDIDSQINFYVETLSPNEMFDSRTRSFTKLNTKTNKNTVAVPLLQKGPTKFPITFSNFQNRNCNSNESRDIDLIACFYSPGVYNLNRFRFVFENDSNTSKNNENNLSKRRRRVFFFPLQNFVEIVNISSDQNF